MKVSFTVLGEPQGKGRPRFARLPNGKTVTRTPDKTVLYENLVVTEYQRKCPGMKFPNGIELDLRITAYFSIPASASKKKQKQMENKELRPTKKPDMDNIIKIIADSLNGIAYYDDTQIVDCQIRKFYSHNPRVEVTILSANNERSQ